MHLLVRKLMNNYTPGSLGSAVVYSSLAAQSQALLFTILRQVSYRMTIILFTVFAGKMCSAVSPLLEDFYSNFGGDPITDESLHVWIIWHVIYCNGASCGTVPDCTA